MSNVVTVPMFTFKEGDRVWLTITELSPICAECIILFVAEDYVVVKMPDESRLSWFDNLFGNFTVLKISKEDFHDRFAFI